jgi:hypothetical protein
MSYDVIGDVRGQAAELEALLIEMGYQKRGGAYRHSDRMAIFVGDLIDRGPGQLKTLELVRAMVDADAARVVMGNHEFNAIAWATPDPEQPGTYLRPRHGAKGNKNRHQHRAFLADVAEDSPKHREWASWFLDLPLWIEEPGFRVVHAYWSSAHAHVLLPHLRDGTRLTHEVVQAASRGGGEIFDAIEVLLKGVEVALPPDVTFTDKDGHQRSAIRTRWWNPTLSTYREAYIGPPGIDLPDLPIQNNIEIAWPDRPTFIGHYWLEPIGPPQPLSRLVACVDYSVAKGGPMVAYRFDGERELLSEKFIAVWP